MKNLNKGISSLVGIIVVVVLAVVVGGVIVWQSRQAPGAPGPTPSPSPTATPTPTVSPTPAPKTTPTPDPTADWKTYRSEEYGFEVKYPPDWTVYLPNQTGFFKGTRVIEIYPLNPPDIMWRQCDSLSIAVTNLSLEDYLAEMNRVLLLPNCSVDRGSFKIGEVMGSKMELCSEFCGGLPGFFIRGPNMNYIIVNVLGESRVKELLIHQQILSTFRFLE